MSKCNHSLDTVHYRGIKGLITGKDDDHDHNDYTGLNLIMTRLIMARKLDAILGESATAKYNHRRLNYD